MILTHYPRTPEGWSFLPRKRYPARGCRGNHKPFAFWLSDEDGFGWSSWCEREAYRGFGGRGYDFQVDADRLLVVRGLDDLPVDVFGEQNADHWTNCRSRVPPRWDLLAQCYAGILVYPHEFAEWKDTAAALWLVSWDCDSAAVWDLSAVRLIAERADSRPCVRRGRASPQRPCS